MSKNKKNHKEDLGQDPAIDAAEITEESAIEDTTPTSNNTADKDTFSYNKRQFKVMAPRFILDNQEYSKDLILKDKALQQSLVEKIFYKEGVFLGEEEVESSVLRIVY